MFGCNTTIDRVFFPLLSCEHFSNPFFGPGCESVRHFCSTHAGSTVTPPQKPYCTSHRRWYTHQVSTPASLIHHSLSGNEKCTTRAWQCLKCIHSRKNRLLFLVLGHWHEACFWRACCSTKPRTPLVFPLAERRRKLLLYCVPFWRTKETFVIFPEWVNCDDPCHGLVFSPSMHHCIIGWGTVKRDRPLFSLTLLLPPIMMAQVVSEWPTATDAIGYYIDTPEVFDMKILIHPGHLSEKGFVVFLCGYFFYFPSR